MNKKIKEVRIKTAPPKKIVLAQPKKIIIKKKTV